MKFEIFKKKKTSLRKVLELTVWRSVRIEKRMYISFSTYNPGPGQEEGEARGEGERERALAGSSRRLLHSASEQTRYASYGDHKPPENFVATGSQLC
jgi:hypothetical protein